MIALHQYPAVYGLSSLSPFCIKIEAYLKLCRIPYKVVTELNPASGPKNKMPFVEDGDQTIADSSLIVSYLKMRYGDALDGEPSPYQHAVGLSIQRLCEDHLYWVLLYARWGDEGGFKETKRNFSPMFPLKLGSLVMGILRKRLLKQGYMQGMLRHSPEEIYQFGREDIGAIIRLLEKSEACLLGKRPSSYDAVVYAFLLVISREPAYTPLKAETTSSAAISRYMKYMEVAVQEGFLTQ